MIKSKTIKQTILIMLIIGLLVLVIVEILKECREIIIREVEPENIGLNLEINFDIQTTSQPKINADWLWDNPSKNLITNRYGDQDIVIVTWDEEVNRWLGTPEFKNLGEGGGGAGMYMVDKLKKEGKGVTYFGFPLKKNGSVTFKLLPRPIATLPSPPKRMEVMFVHPQRNFLEGTILYVIYHDFSL